MELFHWKEDEYNVQEIMFVVTNLCHDPFWEL